MNLNISTMAFWPKFEKGYAKSLQIRPRRLYFKRRDQSIFSKTGEKSHYIILHTEYKVDEEDDDVAPQPLDLPVVPQQVKIGYSLIQI